MRPHASHETRHAGDARLAPHRHAAAYAALVLDGEHLQASCDGILRCPPGTLVLHPAFHAHGNRFGRHGARVLNLPLPGLPGGTTRAWTVDGREAAECLRAGDTAALAGLLVAAPRLPDADRDDWRDALLAALRDEPEIAIGALARRLGVSAAHAARATVRRYGMAPQALRLELRFRRALDLLPQALPLAEVAQRAGFADQSHLTRAVRARCGTTPARLRARIKCVQDAAPGARVECGCTR